MKKFIVVAALLLPSTAFCWEHPQNPDRFPSLGVTYTGLSQEGDFTSATGLSQDVEGTSGSLLIDTRLPLSNSFTLSIGLGSNSSNTKAKDSPTMFASQTDADGGIFTISGRYYFNR